MTRLLQDETKTYDSKGPSRWLSSRIDARRVVRQVAAEIEGRLPTDEQVRDQDELFGVLPEENK